MDDGFRHMLPVEDALFLDDSFGVADPHAIKKQLQSLHNLLRWMLVQEQHNGRDLETAEILVRELERLYKETLRSPDSIMIDEYLHERIKDGFLCLVDFCHDRGRKLQFRRLRLQNLISLVSRHCTGAGK